LEDRVNLQNVVKLPSRYNLFSNMHNWTGFPTKDFRGVPLALRKNIDLSQ